jgi:hypothetical protein
MYFKVLALYSFRVFLLHFCIVLCFSVSDNVAVTAHARTLAIKVLSFASPSYRMMQMLYFTGTGKQDSSRENWASLTGNLHCCGCAREG